MVSKKERIEMLKTQIKIKEDILKNSVKEQQNNIKLFENILNFDITGLELRVNFGRWDDRVESNVIKRMYQNDFESGEGYIIQIYKGGKDITKGIVEIRIPYNEYQNGIELDNEEKYFDIIPFKLNFKNEKEDLEKYNNHKYILTKLDVINKWIEDNIPNCIKTIKEPILILEMEIDLLISEVNKLEDDLKKEGIMKIYELKETGICQTIDLETINISDDEWDEIKYEFDEELKKIQYCKIQKSILVKIKVDYERTHREKSVYGIRNCKKIDKNRWECEFNDWEDEWEKGIIKNENLLKYCENVYNNIKYFEDFTQKGIIPKIDYRSRSSYYNNQSFIHNTNETYPFPIEFGKVYYKLDKEFISEEEYNKKIIYYKNEMILINLKK